MLGAAEALARTYAAVPAPSPTSSMTSTKDRVEKLFLVGSCVVTCDIFLDARSYWDEDGCSLRNRLKFSVYSEDSSASFQTVRGYGLAGPCTAGGGGTAGEIEDGCFLFFFRIMKYPIKTPTPARASARMSQ